MADSRRLIAPSCALLSLAAWAVVSACSFDASVRVAVEKPKPASLTYPAAPRESVIDDYHGTRIADPYRWLEDPDAPRTRAWIEAENQLTQGWIEAVPERAAIRARLEKLWNYERYGVPFKRSGMYFFTKNDGLQNQAVLYVTDALEKAPRVLLDPNTLSKDGTVALGATTVSEDGRFLAYALSEAGSDWQSLHVREIASATDLSDRVDWVKFSGLSWTHDSKGFFYSTFPDHDTTGKVALKNHKLFFHTLGTPAEGDALVYARADQPDFGFAGEVTDDGQMLVINVTVGTEQKNRIYVKDLRDPQSDVLKLLDAFDAEYELIGKQGSTLWFRTDLDAPRGRVIAIDVTKADRANWREIVPQSKDTLESVLLSDDRLVAAYLTDAHSNVRVFELDGRASDNLKFPELGAASAFSGKPDDKECFFAFASFTAPAAIYRYSVPDKMLSVLRAPKVDFKPADYVTNQVFYTSKDKTRIPMFITHRRDVKPSADTPTLLYGYGGFDIPIKPEFRPANIVWMERGGIYASACLRGGGEYGREWHEAGIKEKKQNVFDDFIAAAEYLVKEGYTSSKKLAIHGRSNGGLLVGACLTQRPDLFGATIPGVGVLDMLRYHKFTIGWAWASDYGRADDERAFAYLSKYSPLHNVRQGACYPPTLITTGDHDDRVVPAHSFKFAATMQSAQGCANPILIRIDTRAGHGAGKPTAMQIEEITDEWAFLTRALKIGERTGAQP